MIKTYVINELKRTIAPEEAEKYPSVVIGDDSINGIEFEFPPVFEHFDLYNGVKHIIYIKPNGEKKVKLLTEISEETGRYLWRFDDGINQGDPGVIAFAMMIDEVDDEGTILKTWMSLPAKFNTVNSLAAERRDDADEEETYSERLAAAETALANMQRLISGLASGAPAVAATAAAMTDTEAIYIYTGSETGYSSGHLYYYDGSAWVDFGQYGAAATDSTLSIQGAPADAKATGNKIEQIKEDLSSIQTATSEDAGKALKVKTVANGKVTEWEFGDAGATVDETLSISGEAADAKAVGDKFRTVIKEDVEWSTPANGILGNRGVWQNNSAWISSHTNKLYCEEGWKYVVKGGSYNDAIAPVAFYYNGTTFVSASADSHVIGTERGYTIPSGIDGVIFQVANIPSGGLPVEYYANQISPRTVADVMGATGKNGQVWVKGENDADWSDIDTYIENKADESNLPLPISEDTVGYLQSSGIIRADAGWHCVYTDRIRCQSGWKFRYQGGTVNGLANSVLFFLDDSAVSQEQYPLNSDVEITVPDGVNGVVFQTANAKNGAINLTVTRLYPYALNDVINQLEGISTEIDGLKRNPFYSQFESISIFADETQYAKTYSNTHVNLSPRAIPQNTYIDKVKFKVATAGDGYIVIADKSIYETHLYMRITAMYPVTAEVGWNEVSIGFNTEDNADYIIGFCNLAVVYEDYRVLPKSTDDKYRWGNSAKAYYRLTTTTPAVDVWSTVSTYAASYFECYAFTVIAYTGIIPTAQMESGKAYNYMLVKTQLQDGTLLPKYKVLDGQDYGYVGRWYDWTYNNNAVKVASAAGAEVCFKVKGTASITINWTGDNVTEHVYYCYYIDGAQKVRTNVTDNVITLPDTNEHIVRIVCDSIPHTANVNCWTVGYGWVFGGVNAGNGTLKGIVPTNPSIMYFGDSLTEGVRAYGSQSGSQVEADVDSATESYGWYASKYLGCSSIIVGYGSTGLIVDGYFKKCIDAINYLANGIETADKSPDLIVINHGHNDTGANTEVWSEAFNAVLDRIMVKYPGVKVVGLSPFNGRHKDDMKSCCDARPWCYYINTDNWRLTRFYADGPGHLTAEGAQYCGERLAKAIKAMNLF